MVIQMNFYLNKKISEIVDDFLKFIGGKRLVIHNAEFDISHLNNELALLGKKIINEEVETLQILREINFLVQAQV